MRVTVDRRSKAWLFLRTPFEGIPRIALVLWLVGTALAFFFFNQSDLYHTVLASYAYLDGHVFSFYDFNLTAVGGNDYLPGIYVIFAIWMSPFKLFGGMTPEPLRQELVLSPGELLWAKSLLIVVFMACFYLISAVAKHAFSDNDAAQRTVRTAYLFSPLAGFAVFTFGQYDILSTLFSLLGVLMYLRRRSFWFVFWFSIAISFKYFALFLFIPLAIYYFKRPLRILLALVGGAVFTLIELAAYWHSPAFRVSAFRLAGGKAGDTLHNQLLILMAVLFLVLCILAFLYGRRRQDLANPMILIWLAGFAIMFLAVTWHPQWTVILAPAFALSLGLMRRPGLFLLWESLAFVAFVIVFTNRWAANVDAVMVSRGILSALVGDPTLLQHDIVGSAFEPLANVVFTLFLISPIVWIVCERAVGLGGVAIQPRPSVWIVRVLTVPVVLTLPSLAFTFVPWDTAVGLVPSAVANGTEQVFASEDAPTAVVESDEDVFEQKFRVTGEGLTGLAIPTATYLRTNAGEILVTLDDADGERVADTTVDSASLAQDGRIYLAFAPVTASDGETFTLRVSQESNSPLETVGLWVVPFEAGNGFSKLVLNGETTGNTLLFSYFLR